MRSCCGARGDFLIEIQSRWLWIYGSKEDFAVYSVTGKEIECHKLWIYGSKGGFAVYFRNRQGN